MRVTVFGGTGRVGRALVDELAGRGFAPHAVVRSPEQARSLPDAASTVVADLDYPSSLTDAVADSDAVFLKVPNSPEEGHRALNALSVIVDAGPSKIVYLSADLVDRKPLIPHAGSKLGVEAALRSSGIDFTILRPTYFAQNDELVRDAILAGSYPVPIGRAPLARVDVRDVARAAAAALVDGRAANQTVLVTGREQPTGEETAALWSEALGRPVHYPSIAADDWVHAAVEFMPEWLAFDLQIMYRYLEKYGHPVTDDDMTAQHDVLPAPRTYGEYIAESARHWTAG